MALSPLRVAYQGTPGAYSEGAVLQLFGKTHNIIPVPCQSFENVFRIVLSGEADLALVPIENSLGGSIHNNYDLLMRYKNMHVIHELDFRVRHCLMCVPESNFDDIEVALSHPQAIAQCLEYLRSKNIEPENGFDTAGCAEMIKKQNLKNTAAVASERAAEVYGLKILDKGIEDNDTNFTRFLLLSPHSVKPPLRSPYPVKTSIVFSLRRDTAGGLFRALSVFALRNIDLTKIESRPGKFLHSIVPQNEEGKGDDRYKYLFYVDFTSHCDEEAAQNAMRHLSEIVSFVKILGCYPSSRDPRDSESRSIFFSSTTQKKSDLVIGIIGFGLFGQFLAKKWVQNHTVVATSRTNYSAEAHDIGVEAFYQNLNEFCEKEGARIDILIISTSILSFQKVVDRIDWSRFKNTTVVDVCSVKTHPKKILMKALEGKKGIDILCTHPMFGPDSAPTHIPDSWKGRPFVFHRVKIKNNTRCKAALDLFEKHGCRMVEMTCETHDAYASGSQFVTHFIGRMLTYLGLVNTPINTKGYESLLELKENTAHDSFDLFYSLYKMNKLSHEQMEQIVLALHELMDDLNTFEVNGEQELKHEVSRASKWFNPLVKRVKPSATAFIHDKSLQLKREGKDVISLVAGELHSGTPSEIIEAAKRALDEGKTKYTPIKGTVELREAIQAKLKREQNLDYGLDQIVVSSGAKQSLALAVRTLSRPQSTVLLIAPYWTSYKEMVVLAGARCALLSTKARNNYHFTASELRTVLEENETIKVVLFCTPNNPTGAVYTKAELESYAEVLRDFKDVFVICDEIYEKFVYDPSTETVSFATLEGMKDRTVIVNGFSKTYAMTGFRIGYLAAPSFICEAVARVQSQVSGCASSISQAAATAALEMDDTFVRTTLEELRERRDVVVSNAKKIPYVQYFVPEGAFYFYLDISAYFGWKTKEDKILTDSVDIAGHIIDNYKVALVPGVAFGDPLGIRICFAVGTDELQIAMDRIIKSFAELTPVSKI